MNTYWKNTTRMPIMIMVHSLGTIPQFTRDSIFPNQTVLGEKKTETRTLNARHDLIDIGNGKYISVHDVKPKSLNTPNVYIVTTPMNRDGVTTSNSVDVLGYSKDRGVFRLNEKLETGTIINGTPKTFFRPETSTISTIELGGGRYVSARHFTPVSKSAPIKSSFNGELETSNADLLDSFI